MTDEEIVNAIRAKRYAAAKHEINSRIARFPQKNYYRAVNAFYLLSTGSAKESLKECDAIRAKVPGDSPTLKLLFEVYCKLGRRQDAQSIYANAAKKYPSAELLTAWFDKSVQAFDGQMMHKSALAQRKAFPSNRDYHLASAFADLIWSGETKSEKEAQQVLESASKTMESLEPLQTNQEAFLFASIMMKKKKFSSAIKVLESAQNKELELVLLYLDALDKSEEWETLYAYSHNLLFDQSFNDYDTWRYLIKAGFALKKPQEALSSLIRFDSRNSYVANMEICRVYDCGLEQAIAKYYEKYMAMACCSLDLRAFDVSEKFSDEIVTQKNSLLSKESLSGHEATICINIEKILSRSGNHPLDWKAYARYDNPEFSDLYLASMIQDFSRDLSTTKILEHIVRLEDFAKRDPENFNIKLWLLNLYSTISGSSLALDTYEDLKIKMIQHDILAYKLNLEPSVRNQKQLFNIYRFHLTGENEINAYFGLAFQRGLYTKLEDLYKFGKRLNTSLSKHLVTLHITKMFRMLNNEYYGYFQDLISDIKADVLSDDFTISDNRDFETDYKLGFDLQKVLYKSEAKKSREYVQLYYLKELIIAEAHDGEAEKLIKTLDKWMSNPKYTEALSPSELHFFKLLLAIFKLTKISTKDKDSLTNYLSKNLDFEKIMEQFLSKTSPLSSSATKILVDTLDVVKLIKLLSKEDVLDSLAKKFQQGLVRYVVTNPEVSFFKEVKASLKLSDLPKSFVDSQLERLEDGIRASKFKMR
ncbi:hypothetical protein OXX80_000639 [Metschnikowia pulcherrima]